MRKIVLLFVLVAALMVGQQAKASSYHVNEATVDQLFENAVETSMFDFNAVAMNAVASSSDKNIVDGKDPIIAIVLSGFLGWVGAHRFYLGTEILTGLAYPCLSMLGVGFILVTIDFIMLIINMDNIAPFVDNPALFMWKGMF
jgi:TM2 domain-containing membrane protein YozV